MCSRWKSPSHGREREREGGVRCGRGRRREGERWVQQLENKSVCAN